MPLWTPQSIPCLHNQLSAASPHLELLLGISCFFRVLSTHLSSTQGTQITLGRREAELQKLMPGAYSMSHCFCFLTDSAEPSGDLRTTAVLGFSVFPNLILLGMRRETEKESCSVPLPSGSGHALHVTATPSSEPSRATARLSPSENKLPFLRIWSHFQSGTEVRALQLP